MKKGFIGASVLLTSLVSPAIAEESKSIYMTIGGGAAAPSDVTADSTISGTKYDAKFPTKDNGFYSIGIGREFTNDTRLELNFLSAVVKTDSLTVTEGGNGVTASISPNMQSDVQSFMLYGLKDFKNETKLTPYAGAGLGWATFNAKDQTVTLNGTEYALKGNKESVFSYALKAGATYEIGESTSLYSEATYQNFGDFQVSEDGYETVNYDSNRFLSIGAGLRFTF